MSDGTPIRRDDSSDSADSLPFGAALWAELSAGQGGQRLHAGRQRAEKVGRGRKRVLRYGRLRGRDASSEPGDERGAPLWIAVMLAALGILMFLELLLLVWLGRVGLL